MRILATLLCTFMIMTAGHAKKVKLSLNLEEGKTYNQLTQSIATIDQEFYGQKMNIVMTIEGSMSFLVKAASEEGYDMEVKYERLSMTMNLPQMTMEFSSEKADENDLFSLILAEMKNKPFELKMDKRGKISEIQNVESLWGSVIDLFDQFPLDQREQVKSQLMDAYGEKAMIGSIETVTAIFPETPVKKGGQWDIVTNLEAGMSSTLSTTFTYNGKEDGLVLISGQGTVETTDKEAYRETNGMKMKYDMSGNLTSQLKVDPKSGWISEAKIEQNIEGKAFIQENEQMPDGMEFPVTIKTESTITNK
ncbi:MAG: hypothetical protein GY790_16155 [Bacteroidetes bacterium]|nr:hypothetical protein [Bacteroidota bacterium]